MERSRSTEIKISVLEFEQVLPQICDAKIAKHPDSWTPDNPLFGTCVPVAVVAQRLFGGKLLRASLKPFPEISRKYMNWHWMNRLPNGESRDFTQAQFGNEYPRGMQFIEIPISRVANIPDVAQRSDLLYKRLLKVV